uniref:Uncharacterized protein n=1 Tax=Glossina austeni TaxID=7395 RepID=A0A1A9VV11_GLOAU
MPPQHLLICSYSRAVTPLNLVITVNLLPPLTLSLFFSPVFLIALLSVIVATEEDESPSAQPITFSFLASPSSSFSFSLFFFLSICACNLSLEAICTRWLSSSDTSILETDRQELY